MMSKECRDKHCHFTIILLVIKDIVFVDRFPLQRPFVTFSHLCREKSDFGSVTNKFTFASLWTRHCCSLHTNRKFIQLTNIFVIWIMRVKMVSSTLTVLLIFFFGFDKWHTRQFVRTERTKNTNFTRLVSRVPYTYEYAMICHVCIKSERFFSRVPLLSSSFMFSQTAKTELESISDGGGKCVG